MESWQGRTILLPRAITIRTMITKVSLMMRKSTSTKSSRSFTGGPKHSRRDTCLSFGRWPTTNHWYAPSSLGSSIPFKPSSRILEGTWWPMIMSQGRSNFTRSSTIQASSSCSIQSPRVIFCGISVSLHCFFTRLIMHLTEQRSCLTLPAQSFWYLRLSVTFCSQLTSSWASWPHSRDKMEVKNAI